MPSSSNMALLLGLVFPDEKELGVGDTTILIHIKFCHTFLCFTHFISVEVFTSNENSQHFLLGYKSTVVGVQPQKLLSYLLLLLSLSPYGDPQLAELREVNLLIAVLVRLTYQALGFPLRHTSPNLLYKRAQLCCGDKTIPVCIKQLESLPQFVVDNISHVV